MPSDKVPDYRENLNPVCEICYGAHKTSSHDKFPSGGADTSLLENIKKQPHLGDYDNQFILNNNNKK